MILPNTWNLPASLRIRLGKTTYGRQRAIIEEDHVLLVLHRPPEPDARTRTGVLFWRNPAGEWQWSHGGPGPASLKRHVQTYADLEARLTEDYDKAQNTTALFHLLETLNPLNRAARNQHAALQAAREAVKGDPFLIELRDQAYEIERNFELLLEDTRHALQYRMARDAEEQARHSRAALRASHRLNLLAALFFPVTALASLFGMNLAHGLDANAPWLFWVVLLGGVGVGLALRTWVARRDAE